MNSKLIGGILLIAGTSIGAGMLGLPIATAKGGFMISSMMFVVCWMLMTFTALLTLEVNLCFPKNSNIISMARATLGKPAEFLCWTLYLFLLYALVAAYIAGGQDILRGLLSAAGINISAGLAGIIFVGGFGSIVALGTKQVDLYNRAMMIVKFVTLFFLMYLIAMHVEPQNYISGKVHFVLPALTVMITSFGFSIIVPSLRTYFHDDIRMLRIAILAGSFLPLVCYLIWEAVIFGAVPLNGTDGLSGLIDSSQPITGLMHSIIHYVPTERIVVLTKVFTSVCALTAFACVSLSLSDYLADGMKVKKEGLNKFLVIAATYAPPLALAVFYPRAFILFLSIAGICVVALQALMPAMMAWNVRYTQNMSAEYRVFGGKLTLMLSIVASLVIIFISAYYMALS